MTRIKAITIRATGESHCYNGWVLGKEIPIEDCYFNPDIAEIINRDVERLYSSERERITTYAKV